MKPETDPDFPNIVKPDPQNPVQFQQPVRVGDHEQVVAKMGLEGEPVAGERGGDIYAERNTLTQQDRIDGKTEKQRAEQERELQANKAREHKGFLDANNVRTEAQAEAEEASIPKGSKNLPEGDAKQGENQSPVKTGKPKG